jgi:hypothetical protein
MPKRKAKRSRRAQPAAPPVTRLPPELLTEVLEHACSCAVRSARLAARLLRAPGAAAVTELLAEGGLLPLEAWEAYPRATRLRVGREGAQPAELLPRLLALLPSLPGRVQAITLPRPADQFMFHVAKQWSAAQSEQLAQALVGAACGGGLTQLHLASPCVSTAAADALLCGLPNLRSAQLALRFSDEQAQEAKAAEEQAVRAHHQAGRPGSPEEALPVATWRLQASCQQHLTRHARSPLL